MTLGDSKNESNQSTTKRCRRQAAISQMDKRRQEENTGFLLYEQTFPEV